ncbi:hypothetical protein [Thermaerobacter litoralis]
MSIGGLDGPHAVQSAAEAQRLQRLPAEAARGEEQAQRFAARLDEARRRTRVPSAGGMEAAGRPEDAPRSGADGAPLPSPAAGDRGGRRGRDGGRPKGRDPGHPGSGEEPDPSPRGEEAALPGGRGAAPAPASPPAGGRGPVPLPEELPLKGRRLDRSV